ncbi:MAG TPA: hypothetical protein VEG30_10520 [Terriglobales bacterium]|nr:hypothetical protein [Terriglobales bacterium]
MAKKKKDDLPKNIHGQGFPDRPAGDKSRYDPEFEIPDPEAVEEDIAEVETVYRPEKKKPA